MISENGNGVRIIILIDKPSKLKKLEVLNWFGYKKQYEQYHSEKHQMIKEEKLFFEDDN